MQIASAHPKSDENRDREGDDHRPRRATKATYHNRRSVWRTAPSAVMPRKMKSILVAAILGLPTAFLVFPQSYTISTIAGNGTTAAGTNITTDLATPQGIAVDTVGNSYITDVTAHVVWKATPDDTLT